MMKRSTVLIKRSFNDEEEYYSDKEEHCTDK